VNRLFTIASVIGLAGCPKSYVPATVDAEAMGGRVRVVIRCPDADEYIRCMDAANLARDEVHRLDQIVTSGEGDIAKLNQSTETVIQVADDLRTLFETANRVSSETDGAFDITVGTLAGLWDFERGTRPNPASLNARLAAVDWQQVRLTDAGIERPLGVKVTLGGMAQGFAAQRALALIPDQWEALVEVSGDVAVRGSWTLHIPHPRQPLGHTLARVTLRDAVIVTSGDYEQGFALDGVRYHHILDPRTGYPSNAAMSATVVHPNGAIADALATALLVTGPNVDDVDNLGAWALVIDSDGQQHQLGSAKVNVREP
jgi:FAD:protein FMN transferase